MEKFLDGLEDVYNAFVTQLNEITGKNYEQWTRPTREEWRLDSEMKMSREKMILIAKARWIYHKQRCRLDYGQRKRPNVEAMTDILKEELNTTVTREIERELIQAERQNENSNSKNNPEQQN